MKNSTARPMLLSAVAGLAALGTGLTGCAPTGPTVVDDSQLITTTGLDVQDVARFAEELATELTFSGTLGTSGEPSIIIVEDFKNNTRFTNITRNRVLGPVRSRLNRSDVAKVFAGATRASGAESGEAAIQNEIDEFESGQAPERQYDYTLQVELNEDRAFSGNTTQVSYIVYMKLVDLNGSLIAWEDERRITKQEQRSGFGF